MKRKWLILPIASVYLSLCCAMIVPDAVVRTETDGVREIVETYSLPADEDPETILKDTFEQDGYLYTFQEIVKAESADTQSRNAEKTMEFETKTNKLEDILPDIPGSIPYDEGDGFVGELSLDTASITTKAKGYAKNSYTVSDTRVYTGLAYNDPSLIPQTVTKNGLTLNLAGVTWQGEGGTGANGSLIPSQYTATASYSTTASSTYATGYITTARYTGEVKLTTSTMTYTVTYKGTPVPAESEEKEIFPTAGNNLPPAFLAVGIASGVIVIVLIFIYSIRMPRSH